MNTLVIDFKKAEMSNGGGPNARVYTFDFDVETSIENAEAIWLKDFQVGFSNGTVLFNVNSYRIFDTISRLLYTILNPAYKVLTFSLNGNVMTELITDGIGV